MNRRGFVLLTVLWVVTGLTALAAALLASARVAGSASRNRILLSRASWAAEACLAILQADTAMAEGPLVPIDLGGGSWCKVILTDPSRRLNVNAASAEQLGAIIHDDSLLAAILDWRDRDSIPRPHGAERGWYAAKGMREPRDSSLVSLDELSYVRGWALADMALLSASLTVDGTGRINPNVAPAQVLSALPGLVPEGVEAILRARVRAPFRSYEALLDALPPLARARVLQEYRSFLASSILDGTVITATVTGWVVDSDLRATISATLIPSTGRLTVLRKRVT